MSEQPAVRWYGRARHECRFVWRKEQRQRGNMLGLAKTGRQGFLLEIAKSFGSTGSAIVRSR